MTFARTALSSLYFSSQYRDNFTDLSSKTTQTPFKRSSYCISNEFKPGHNDSDFNSFEERTCRSIFPDDSSEVKTKSSSQENEDFNSKIELSKRQYAFYLRKHDAPSNLFTNENSTSSTSDSKIESTFPQILSIGFKSADGHNETDKQRLEDKLLTSKTSDMNNSQLCVGDSTDQSYQPPLIKSEHIADTEVNECIGPQFILDILSQIREIKDHSRTDSMQLTSKMNGSFIEKQEEQQFDPMQEELPVHLESMTPCSALPISEPKEFSDTFFSHSSNHSFTSARQKSCDECVDAYYDCCNGEVLDNIAHWQPGAHGQIEFAPDVEAVLAGSRQSAVISKRSLELYEEWREEEDKLLHEQEALDEYQMRLLEEEGEMDREEFNGEDESVTSELKKNEKEWKKLVKKEIKQAKNFMKTYGAWPEKPWIKDEEEKEMWEKAKEKVIAKSKLDASKQTEDVLNEEETIEEMQGRLYQVIDSPEENESLEELTRDIVLKKEKMERQEKKAGYTNLDKYLIEKEKIEQKKKYKEAFANEMFLFESEWSTDECEKEAIAYNSKGAQTKEQTIQSSNEDDSSSCHQSDKSSSSLDDVSNTVISTSFSYFSSLQLVPPLFSQPPLISPATGLIPLRRKTFKKPRLKKRYRHIVQPHDPKNSILLLPTQPPLFQAPRLFMPPPPQIHQSVSNPSHPLIYQHIQIPPFISNPPAPSFSSQQLNPSYPFLSNPRLTSPPALNAFQTAPRSMSNTQRQVSSNSLSVPIRPVLQLHPSVLPPPYVMSKQPNYPLAHPHHPKFPSDYSLYPPINLEGSKVQTENESKIKDSKNTQIH